MYMNVCTLNKGLYKGNVIIQFLLTAPTSFDDSTLILKQTGGSSFNISFMVIRYKVGGTGGGGGGDSRHCLTCDEVGQPVPVTVSLYTFKLCKAAIL